MKQTKDDLRQRVLEREMAILEFVMASNQHASPSNDWRQLPYVAELFRIADEIVEREGGGT